MRLRRTQIISLVVTIGLTLAISGGLSLAAEQRHTERGKPLLVGPVYAEPKALPVPLAFTLMDVSLDGDRLTLSGQRRDGSGPVRVAIKIPATPPADNAEALFRRVFDRDDAP